MGEVRTSYPTTTGMGMSRVVLCRSLYESLTVGFQISMIKPVDHAFDSLTEDRAQTVP